MREIARIIFISMVFRAYLFTLLLLLSSEAQASTDAAPEVVTGAEIHRSVVEALDHLNAPFDIRLNQARRFYPCSSPLRVQPVSANWRTVQVHCDEPRSWTVHVRTGVVLAPAEIGAGKTSSAPTHLEKRVILAQSVRADDILTPDHLSIGKIATRRAMGGFVEIEHLVGRRMKQSLGVGQAIQARHLHPSWVVEAGQIVEIEHKIGQIKVVSEGKALENGRVGDLIEVENEKNGEKRHFFVVASKKVATGPKMARVSDVKGLVGE